MDDQFRVEHEESPGSKNENECEQQLRINVPGGLSMECRLTYTEK